jgi:hypothetical protein
MKLIPTWTKIPLNQSTMELDPWTAGFAIYEYVVAG